MPASEIVDVWPLTPLQEGLLFHAVYDEAGVDVYALQTIVRLEGRVDGGRLRLAVEGLLRRHASLRVGFRWVGLSRPVQVVVGDVVVPWVEVEFAGVGDVGLAEFLRVDRGRRFEMGVAPLVRCALVRVGVEESWLVLTCHHVLMDGWSLPVVLGELMRLYESGGDGGV
ncbi:condensation domain-containing protein, partial [Sphaerisporangium sp. B11E5]|uniref:condensation domain-containing protein n=1 Tax=Sphaerisporangium sp. B11E5 TaxID=3153563 RepID=UPI00325DABFC